eukprot:1439315-Rhodomonas_salina.1
MGDRGNGKVSGVMCVMGEMGLEVTWRLWLRSRAGVSRAGVSRAGVSRAGVTCGCLRVQHSAT